jgi:hypothetical protein
MYVKISLVQLRKEFATVVIAILLLLRDKINILKSDSEDCLFDLSDI